MLSMDIACPVLTHSQEKSESKSCKLHDGRLVEKRKNVSDVLENTKVTGKKWR